MISFELQNPLFNYYFFACLVGQSSNVIPGYVVFRLSHAYGLELYVKQDNSSTISFGKLPRSCLTAFYCEEESTCWKVSRNALKTVISDYKNPTKTRIALEPFTGLDQFVLSTSTEESRIPLVDITAYDISIFDADEIRPNLPVTTTTNFKVPATKLLGILESVTKKNLFIKIRQEPPGAILSADEGAIEWTINVEHLHVPIPLTTGEIPSDSLPILIQSLRLGIEARRDMRVLVTLAENSVHFHYNIL